MKAISMAPLALVEEELFTKTVSNVKIYSAEFSEQKNKKRPLIKMVQIATEYFCETIAIYKLLPKKYSLVLILFSPSALIFLMCRRILTKLKK
jgi:hypothetical protein